MDANTIGWGATKARLHAPGQRRARRLVRALAALERWAELYAGTLATSPSPLGEPWADGAQSALADLGARLAERARRLRSGPPADDPLGQERAWCEAARDEALAAAAQGDIDPERLHALGRAAVLAEAARRLTMLSARCCDSAHRRAAPGRGARDIARSRPLDITSSHARDTAGSHARV